METLTRDIPAWSAREQLVRPRPTDEKLSNDDLYDRLRPIKQLLSDTRHDHFSRVFYNTQYDSLPSGVKDNLVAFRTLADKLDGRFGESGFDDVLALKTAIDYDGFRRRLDKISDSMQQLAALASEVQDSAMEIRRELILELQHASKELSSVGTG